MSWLGEKLADLYVEMIRHRRDLHSQGRGRAGVLSERPAFFKTYENPLAVISLPEPVLAGGVSLWQSLSLRRSRRSYIPKALSLEYLSQLLWATGGITAIKGKNFFRTAPSGGARYPIEIYVVVKNVDHLAPGIYHYEVRGHHLEQLRAGDFSAEISSIGLDRPLYRNAAVAFILTAVIGRTRWRYGETAHWFISVESGHIMQNLCLAATALGLGSCPIGAFFGNEMDNLLGLDSKEEFSLYVCTVGCVKEMAQEPGEWLDVEILDGEIQTPLPPIWGLSRPPSAP